MLRVLQHYLPIRKALLIVGETLILSLVLAAFMTAHLWNPTATVTQALARELPAMKIGDALTRCYISAALLAVLSQIALAFNELYDVRVSGSRYDRAARFVESAGSALGLTLAAVVLADFWDLRRVLDFPPLSLAQRVQTLVLGILAGFLLLYFWRAGFHYLLHRSFRERVLILGSGKAAHAVAHEILDRPDTGFEVIGLLPFAHATDGASGGRRGSGPIASEAVPRWDTGTSTRVDVHAPKLEEPAAAAPSALARTQALVLEPLPQAKPETAAVDVATSHASTGNGSSHAAPMTLVDLVKRERVDVVVVALEDRRSRLPIEQLLACRLAGISVREQEALYEKITGKIAVEALRPSYLIFNEGFSRDPWAGLAKRALDIVSSSVLLLLTWPLMIATAIAVRMDSPGPILFTQERVGRNGKPFTLLKFRSMYADAEKRTGPVWATEDDPRVTRSGRFIRRARLDELPQIFNVLSGDMSLVGPRPERQHFVDELANKIPYFRQRHIVKPGITGWAQINYRYGSSFEDALQKLQYDLFYIKNQSLLFDLSILFNTVKIVILRKGT